jgi:TonB family protein
MYPRTLLAARALSLLGATAAHSQVVFDAPPGRRCVKSVSYIPEPSVAELTDSASLVAELDAIVAGLKAAPSHLVDFEIRFLANGTLKDVRVFPRALGRERAALQETVSRLVLPQPVRPKPFSWGLSLEKDSASAVRLEVHGPLACPPAIDNRDAVARSLSWEVGAYQQSHGRLPTGGRRVMVKMRILPDGTPTSLGVVRSSGEPSLDQAAIRVMYGARFLPGLAYVGSPELVAVPVLVQMPVTFMPGPAPR